MKYTSKNKMELESISKKLKFPIDDLVSFPKYLHIETINSCNARCIMCGINFEEKSYVLMSHDLFAKILKELEINAKNIEKVMPYLDGEPLLDKEIFNRIIKLKKINIKTVNIASNASLLTNEKIDECLRSGLDEIYITIDSLNADTYEKIRKGLKLENVLNNTNNLIAKRNKNKSNLKIRIQMVLQKNNENEVATFINYWKDILGESDEVVIQRGHNWAGEVKQDVLFPHIENLDPCIALWGTFVCHSNGEVPLCCMDTQTKHKLGSLETEEIKQIWNSEKLKKMRDIHLSKKRFEIDICKNCDLWSEHKKETY